MSPLPKELNPAERLYVRFVFATWKLMLLVPVGIAVGYAMERWAAPIANAQWPSFTP